MNTKKEIKYATILIAKMSEIFDNEHEHHIDRNEMLNNENLTHFIHALANMMPNHIYNVLTDDNKNNLEFNHLCNSLVVQYLKKD